MAPLCNCRRERLARPATINKDLCPADLSPVRAPLSPSALPRPFAAGEPGDSEDHRPCPLPRSLPLAHARGPTEESNMELRWAARGARAAAMARERIAKTGIAPGGHPIWTDREMALLAVIYPDYQRAIAVLGRRSYWALRHRAQIMGLTSNHHHRWTGAEISRLRKLYPTADNIALLNAFPGLSLSQIQRRATHSHIYRKRRPFKKNRHQDYRSNPQPRLRAECIHDRSRRHGEDKSLLS